MEKSNVIKIVQYVFQVILGGMLVVAGYLKLQDNSALFESVAYITWIPIGLKSLIVDLLPWVEVIVGSLLVLNLFKMVTVPLTGLIYLTFFIYAIYGLGSGIEGDCGCFGDLDESSLIGSLLGSEIGWRMVIRNGVFLLMSLSLFWKPNSSK
jgi:uncharacterized membrane protein YphA (DoxX/SURF4 family)